MGARPWAEALRQQYACLRDARTIGDDGLPQASSWKDAEYCRDMCRVASRILPRAQPYIWAAEPSAAVALAAQTTPLDVYAHDLLPDEHHEAFWWFDPPVEYRLAHHAEPIFHSIPVIIIGRAFPKEKPGEVQILVCRYMRSWDSFIPTFALSVPPGDPIVARDIDPAGRAAARFVVAANVWLRQRIITTSAGPIERHQRKQLARDLGQDLLPVSDVKVVTLRRPEAPAHEHAPSSVEWSCRWPVAGHWRRQSVKDGHRLTYISPYIKGPADRPLRLPTTTVYDVKR